MTKSPSRVAFCITDLAVGGAERALVELVTRLDRAEFEPRVICLQPLPEDPTRSLAPALAAAGAPVDSLNLRGLSGAPAAIGRLSALLRDWRPDVVQSFLFHANMLARLAARRAGRPKVVCGIRVAEKSRPLRLRADRWTDRFVDRHVCVSRSVAEFSRTVGGLPAEKLLVIPNAVDVARFANATPTNPAALDLPTGRRWITFVGRLDPQKNLAWLIEGAARWLPQLPQHDLLLVGDGPLRGALTSQIARLGLQERIRLVGWQADTPGILAASDALVLPSLWEGMPNVVLEAMAAGKPVLATDVEGVRELLGENDSGQIAPRGDAHRWQAQLLSIVRDAALAARLGGQNQARAAADFSHPSAVAAYSALYHSLVENDAGAAGAADRSLTP